MQHSCSIFSYSVFLGFLIGIYIWIISNFNIADFTFANGLPGANYFKYVVLTWMCSVVWLLMMVLFLSNQLHCSCPNIHIAGLFFKGLFFFNVLYYSNITMYIFNNNYLLNFTTLKVLK